MNKEEFAEIQKFGEDNNKAQREKSFIHIPFAEKLILELS